MPRTLKGYYYNQHNMKQSSADLRQIWEQTDTCRGSIKRILGIDPGRRESAEDEARIMTAAYLLARACEFYYPFDIHFKSLEALEIDPMILEFAKKKGISRTWKALSELLRDYKQNIFYIAACLKEDHDPLETPEGICILAEELLDLKEGDTFADLCCGSGAMTVDIRMNYPEVDVTGIEIDECRIIAARIYAYISEVDITFIHRDMFETDEKHEMKYSRIFADFPLGMRQKDLEAGETYCKKLRSRIPKIKRATSADWVYAMRIVDMLAKDGKAAAIMTVGNMCNALDAPVRTYLAENGLVECIISLPAKLYGATSTPIVLILFGHTSGGVRLVDATTMYTPGRRVNELDDDSIDQILDAVKKDGAYSKVVSLDELRAEDYVFSLDRYTGHAEDAGTVDKQPLGMLIRRITRGASVSAAELDHMVSPVPTRNQYLLISNINNGLMDTSLPYLSKIDKKDEKYCLSNRCLILAKNGYPYKVAVAEVKKGYRILASGNLYIIEPDETRIDPYYLAAYLSSEKGMAALKSITTGASIQSLSVEQLKNLLIPVPDMILQKEAADRYCSARDEIRLLQKRLEKAKKRLSEAGEMK